MTSMTLTVAMGREGRKSIGEARQGHGVETHLHPEQGSSTQEEHTAWKLDPRIKKCNNDRWVRNSAWEAGGVEILLGFGGFSAAPPK